MKLLKLMAPMLGAALLAGLAGCGSDNRESSSAAQVVASQACIACHTGTLSSVTGNSVVTEWLRSAHASKPGGAGCNDCHQVGDHPANGAVPAIPNNRVCITCHTVTVPIATASAHFSTYSASYTGLPLSRMNDGLVNPAAGDPSGSSCNGCHNPHDMTSLLPVNKQWAQSAHGAVNDDAFYEEGSVKASSCNRCHSGTGFRYYMTHAQTSATASVLGKYSSAKEAIGCSACHTNYSWKRISNDSSVTSFVTFSTPYKRFANVSKNFPSNVGDGKLCIPCHAGRTGRAGGDLTSSSTSTDPHYFPAAGTMYLKIGFINFTSQSAVIGTSTYGKSLISSDDLSGGVTSTHRKLGTTAINGDSHNPSFFVPGNLDSGGPCVACHMTAGHTLKINGDAFDRVCSKCHSSEGTTTLTSANFDSAFLEPQREVFMTALSLAVKLLEDNYDITVQLADIESPQESSFVRKSTGASMNSTGWTAYVGAGQPGAALTSTQLYKLKGAMYNIALGYKENAAFVHARTYTRRLVYDTIDYLDDGKINMSVGATAVAQSLLGNATTNPVFGKYVKGATAAAADGTTESIIYLLGYNRTSLAWNASERP